MSKINPIADKEPGISCREKINSALQDLEGESANELNEFDIASPEPGARILLLDELSGEYKPAKLEDLTEFSAVDIPLTQLDENSPETELARVSFEGKSNGLYRIQWDLFWDIVGSGDTSHQAIFRLYVTDTVTDTLLAEYSREPKDSNDIDWSSKGITAPYSGNAQEMFLTCEMSQGSNNPLLNIRAGSLQIEKKADQFEG